MRISDWSSDVCSSDLRRLTMSMRPFRLFSHMRPKVTLFCGCGAYIRCGLRFGQRPPASTGWPAPTCKDLDFLASTAHPSRDDFAAMLTESHCVHAGSFAARVSIAYGTVR